MAAKQRKVFCENCQSLAFDAGDYWCRAEGNCIDTWLEPCGEREKPKTLNRDNDCPYYKPKES